MTDQQQQLGERKIGKQVVERDGMVCYLCGRKVRKRKGGTRRYRPDNFTLDHVVPASKGGPTSVANLRVCCQECNARKADQ